MKLTILILLIPILSFSQVLGIEMGKVSDNYSIMHTINIKDTPTNTTTINIINTQIMGKYINEINGNYIGSSFSNKSIAIKKAGGVRIPTPTVFQPNLVCIIDNGAFSAAGYIYDEEEFKVFLQPDPRPKQWFILENAETYID